VNWKIPRGSCALVTGASSGIGRAVALGLAARGVHCVLAGRNRKRLTELARVLSGDYGIETGILVQDLSQPGAGEKLYRAAKRAGYRIDILVNNAGAGLKAAPQHGQDLADVRTLLALNCAAVLELATLCAADMAKNGRGWILNVASTASFQAMPWAALYGATKAFVLSLSEAMHVELFRSGVAVTAICPGITDTNFFKHGKPRVPGWLYPFLTPERVARIGLAALSRNAPVAIPAFRHWLFAQFPRVLPRALLLRLMGVIEGRRKGVRTRKTGGHTS